MSESWDSMSDEIKAAAQWWSDQLPTVSGQQKALFTSALETILKQQYTGHWYEEDPIRGSAYRSISYDEHLDPKILMAAKIAGIVDSESKLFRVKECIMWVNPGEVKIRGGGEHGVSTYVWTRRKFETINPDEDEEEGLDMGVPVRDDCGEIEEDEDGVDIDSQNKSSTPSLEDYDGR